MYKYTYLLSDSYRHEQLPSHLLNNHKNKDIHSQSFSQNCSVMSYQRQAKQKNISKEVINARNINPLSQVPSNIPSTVKYTALMREKLPVRAKHNNLQDRLKKLDNLSVRHNDLLKGVEIQSKIKTISEKYGRKEQQRSSYQVYKKQKERTVPQQQNCHNIYASNQNKYALAKIDIPIVPISTVNSQIREKYYPKQLQAMKPAQPQFYQTRTKVKSLVEGHINQQKKQQINDMNKYECIKPSNQVRPQMKKQKRTDMADSSQTMLKLSSLQQRIKSSIKPYINM